MEIIPLNCGGCGAPLEISPKANYVTCGFCKVQLQVKHEGNAHWTEALEDVRDKLEGLERQVQLAALEREWEAERKRHLITDKHGQEQEPSEVAATFMPILMTIVGIIVGVALLCSEAPALSPVGLFIIVWGFFWGDGERRKAAAFQEARRSYEARKRALLQEV